MLVVQPRESLRECGVLFGDALDLFARKVTRDHRVVGSIAQGVEHGFDTVRSEVFPVDREVAAQPVCQCWRQRAFVVFEL